MCDLPDEVADDETIVRVVIDGFHVKNGKLHRNLFRGPHGIDRVSAIRHNYRDATFCKRHGKEKVQNAIPPKPRLYVGLAAVQAGVARGLGGYVKDTREEFLGHADLGVGMERPAGDPPNAQELERFNNHIDRFLARTRYYPDPDIPAPEWTGPDLIPG